MTTDAQQYKLNRVLRVRDGWAVTVGIVIGAGILGTPGLIAGYLGDPWIILGLWAFGGVVAALSTLVLAEMAAALPEAGGKYVYARHAWGPTMGFVAGWSELIVSRGFSGASKAVLIATYILTLNGNRGSVPIVALAVVLGFFLLHTRGLRASTTFQNVTTAVKVLIVLAIAGAGIWGGDLAGFTAAPLITSSETVGLLGYALAYQSISFAYYGWEDAAKMAEEVKDPGVALPRILLGGALAVMVLYILMNVSFLAALTPAEMATSDLVAADAIASVFGGSAGTVVVVASLLILISSANVNFLGLPRVAYGLAQHGLAPRAFSRVDERGTPRNALIFISAWIGLLALTGSFEMLIRFMMTVAITVDTMVLLGYFRLRAKRPDLERPFRMPGHPWLPALTIVLYIMILVILVSTQPQLAAGAWTMLAAMLVAGVITVRGSSGSRGAASE
ncbi:MAG: APC family permease [Gemmatimonadetes bacterium]|nr:APC family permease [Gemmatimonadota bacterium]MDA1102035.1 APC family permease [Gemmatimonadota bacterium]